MTIFSEYTILSLVLALFSLFPLFLVKGKVGQVFACSILACSLFTLTKMANAEIEYNYKLEMAGQITEHELTELDPIRTGSICPPQNQ